MIAQAIPSSGIVVADAGLSMSSDLLVLRSEAFFRRSRKFVGPGFLHLAPARHRNTQPIFCLSAEPQVDIETSDNEIQEMGQSKTVHIKFQVQKECAFGDELLLVGDDPMFGLWDPENGVPLTWSEGHVWVVEMDMPIRKTVQFKFILKTSTGTIIWQSGADRTFQSWETNNTITVCEDWEDAEQQKLIEDDGYPSPNQIEDSTTNSEVLVIAEKLTCPKEEPLSETSNRSFIANNSSYPAEELVFTHSNLSQEVKPMAIVADNIGNPKKDYVVNAANEFLDAVGKNDRVAAVNSRSSEVDESQITWEGGPVLVPGLTSFSMLVESEEAVQFEGEKRGTVGVSDGPNDAKNPTVPELEKKQELDGDTCQQETTTETFINEDDSLEQQLLLAKAGDVVSLEQQPLLAKAEDVANEEEHQDVLKQGPQFDNAEDVANEEEHQDVLKQEPQFAKAEDVANEQEHEDVLKQGPQFAIEEQASSVPNSNEVIVNDIQWGRRALQKLMANLGLGLG